MKRYLQKLHNENTKKIFYIKDLIVSLFCDGTVSIFINNQLVPVTTVISSLYESHKDEDGFMYICCSEENTFG